MNDYSSSEEWRRICEARQVLRDTCPNGDAHGNGNAINRRLAAIQAKRGKQAADELREEMRRQYQCRAKWWRETAEEAKQLFDEVRHEPAATD